MDKDINTRNHTTKDCDCITHEGPHYLHMDRLWREQNREHLERLKRDVETNNRADAPLAAQAFALTELARLKEKEFQMIAYERWMKR